MSTARRRTDRHAAAAARTCSQTASARASWAESLITAGREVNADPALHHAVGIPTARYAERQRPK
jgi:hypothetical protein